MRIGKVWAMTAVSDANTRLVRLEQLSPDELNILLSRCAGCTSHEIAQFAEIPYPVARQHMGNIYDKLGLTWLRGDSTLRELEGFCSLLHRLSTVESTSPPLANLTSEPPPQPSALALELVALDDQAIRAGRMAGSKAGQHKARRETWIRVGGIIVMLLVALLIVLR